MCIGFRVPQTDTAKKVSLEGRLVCEHPAGGDGKVLMVTTISLLQVCDITKTRNSRGMRIHTAVSTSKPVKLQTQSRSQTRACAHFLSCCSEVCPPKHPQNLPYAPPSRLSLFKPIPISKDRLPRAMCILRTNASSDSPRSGESAVNA